MEWVKTTSNSSLWEGKLTAKKIEIDVGCFQQLAFI